MRRNELLALTVDTTASALREQQVRSLIEAGIVRSPDIVRSVLGLTDKAFCSFCEQIGTDIIATGKRGDGASQPDVDDDTLRRINEHTGPRIVRDANGRSSIQSTTEKEIRDTMRAKQAAEAAPVDARTLKSLANNGLADDYAKGCKANAPGPIGSTSMDQHTTSRALHLSIAPDDEPDPAAKGAAAVRELRALEGGAPKRNAMLETLGNTDAPGTIVATRR